MQKVLRLYAWQSSRFLPVLAGDVRRTDALALGGRFRHGFGKSAGRLAERLPEHAESGLPNGFMRFRKTASAGSAECPLEHAACGLPKGFRRSCMLSHGFAGCLHELAASGLPEGFSRLRRMASAGSARLSSMSSPKFWSADVIQETAQGAKERMPSLHQKLFSGFKKSRSFTSKKFILNI